MIEYLKDKWLTWHTGMPKSDRDYYRWHDTTIVSRASTVQNYYMNFKHIIAVRYDAVYTTFDPFYGDHIPCQDFLSYMYPNRPLGKHSDYRTFRGFWDQWDRQFHINDIRCELDQMFVATNCEKDAIMIALKYS